MDRREREENRTPGAMSGNYAPDPEENHPESRHGGANRYKP